MSQNNENKLVDLAVKSNFNKAVIIDTFKITFNPIFREYCKENICGQYNKNLSCPPFCGTYEQMKTKVLSYKKALVFQSKFTIDNLKDDNVIKRAQKWHNTTMFKVIQSFDIKDGLFVGASHCILCDSCEKKQKCKHPKSSYSCLSAYCIDVKKLAEICCMNYDFKDNTLYLFGLYLFN